jgi:O-succinylbenzoic acid--CoA ligase
MIVEIDFSGASMLPDSVEAQWYSEVISFVKEWRNEHVNSFYIRTSGSTSTPKEITFSREDLLKSVARTNAFFNLNSQSVFFNCLPLSHISGMMMVVRAIVAKGKLVCVKPSSNPLMQLTPVNNVISFAAFTPMQVFEILGNENSATEFSKIENVIIGGAKVSEELINKLKGYSNNIYETYGMTETFSHIALRKIAPEFSFYFQVMPGVEIKLGAQDNLKIRIDTSEWIETKDVVTMKDESRFSWKGRLDDVINTGGEKVFVSEIEAILSKAIVFNFYITKMEDEVVGEKVAFVTDYDVDISFLKKIILDYLSPYQRPRIFIQLIEIKQSSLGKTQRYFSTEEIIKKVNLSYS